jgi:glutathione S-transferase
VTPGEKLFPADPRKAAEVEQWISIGNSVVDPCFIRRYVVPYVFAKDGVPDRAKIDAAAEEMKPVLAKLDDRLSKKPFLGGDSYSYADANVTPMLFYLGRFPEGKAALAEATHVASYLRRMMDRPSFGAAKPPPPPQN